jgi:hypothetical protein
MERCCDVGNDQSIAADRSSKHAPRLARPNIVPSLSASHARMRLAWLTATLTTDLATRSALRMALPVASD